MWIAPLVLWVTATAAASLISALRGYTAIYGFLLAFFSIAIPLVGPVLAVFAVERWTRELPQRPIHTVRWPYRAPVGAAVPTGD